MAGVAAIVCVRSVCNEVSYSGLFGFGWACHTGVILVHLLPELN